MMILLLKIFIIFWMIVFGVNMVEAIENGRTKKLIICGIVEIPLMWFMVIL